ncbi:MAG TPA: tetratricopeptide repeat protein [Acidobacteriaceae bacterium]
MASAHSRLAIAILIGVSDKHRFGRVGLPMVLAGAALMCGAQQIGTLTPSPPVQASALQTAQQLIHDGKFAQAEPMLRALIAADAKAAEPHYLLAYSLLRQDKPAESLKEYTEAAALRTPTATELRNVALDYVLLKALPEADRWMSRSLAMDGNDAETWYAMGRLRYTEGRYDDAAACFEKTLALNPRSVKSEDNLGLAYEGLNRNDDAVRAYRAAIEMQKDDPAPSEQPLLNLAILLQHRNQVQEAQQLLEQAAKIAPREPRIHENLGQVYLHSDRTEDAVKEFAAAVALAPQNPRFHYLLGQAYRRSGDAARAKQEFARSAALNGTHSTPEHQ